MALAGDRDGLFDGAHAHLGVDRRRERPGQLEALPLDGVEPGQGEGNRVGAAAQLLDSVLPRTVTDHGPHLLDERRARCLDRDAGQDGAGVPDGSGDGCLRKCQRQQQNQASTHEPNC
jgi:hypothetical protein